MHSLNAFPIHELDTGLPPTHSVHEIISWTIFNKLPYLLEYNCEIECEFESSANIIFSFSSQTKKPHKYVPKIHLFSWISTLIFSSEAYLKVSMKLIVGSLTCATNSRRLRKMRPTIFKIHLWCEYQSSANTIFFLQK